MKIRALCLDCVSEANADRYVLLPIQDNPVYQFTCLRGHKRTMQLDQQRFEMLAEVAVQAIVDGYYREAVTSFAGCLERFMEFGCRVLVEDQEVTSKALEAAWKVVSKQSERQLGMFLMAYLMRWGEPGPTLPNPAAQLRNQVVHSGYLPSRGEAIEFGQVIISLIQPVLTQLVNEAHPAVKRTVDANAISARIAVGVTEMRHTHGLRPLFQWHDQPNVGENLAVEVERRTAEGERRLLAWPTL